MPRRTSVIDNNDLFIFIVIGALIAGSYLDWNEERRKTELTQRTQQMLESATTAGCQLLPTNE